MARYMVKMARNDPNGNAEEMLSPEDRWGRTPLDDAISGEHKDTQRLLIKYGGKRGAGENNSCNRIARISLSDFNFIIKGIILILCNHEIQNFHPCNQNVNTVIIFQNFDPFCSKIVPQMKNCFRLQRVPRL